MVTDQQVRRLFMINETENSKTTAAAKAGMDPKTARKYIKSGKLPSQIKCNHDWRTRQDPFDKDWSYIADILQINLGLEAKTIFEYLQSANPGGYQDSQLRTLQRKIKQWRAADRVTSKSLFLQVWINHENRWV